MPELNMGVQGAKRSRYFPDSPDALLRKIVEENPRALEAELEEKFEEAVLKYGGQILSAIIAYWFANRYRALRIQLTPPSVRRAMQTATAAKTRETVEAKAKAVVTTVARTLIDKMAPACGKPVRDMTKQECEREGGWFLKVATKLKPRQTVGQALTDEELWALYRS